MQTYGDLPRADGRKRLWKWGRDQSIYQQYVTLFECFPKEKIYALGRIHYIQGLRMTDDNYMDTDVEDDDEDIQALKEGRLDAFADSEEE